ncbi:MAG: hypothetical protein TR69_WS6001000588 [candidate division WS6 bacterium OLB20]|uniref:Prepilin-type N-terminal cleavage/methylation domain-containing protein n=1 Tax=candidate division WS6 bacterium OLB20 TaxID=1617426 RepID=A0A136LY40_9BACT|nr:MAG: hypothetical protein TR69_WS6001000588 [candidate division WS6 bacterium OLB20]
MMMKKLPTKRLQGFSLVETLITLAIFGIMIAMISQVILINLEVSRKVYVRTQVREELAELTTLVQRDIRNARIVKECGEFRDGSETVSRCTISHAEEFTWTDNCPGDTAAINRICKISVPGNQLLFETSDLITIEDFSFDINLSTGEDGTKSTILMTLRASATNPNFEISNQVRQIAVSTRNFTLGDFFVGATPTAVPTAAAPTQVSCPHTGTTLYWTDTTTGAISAINGQIPCGRTVRIAAQHGSAQANDVTFYVQMPGQQATQQMSVTTVQLDTPGTYNFSGNVPGYAGSACQDTVSVTCANDPQSQCPFNFTTLLQKSQFTEFWSPQDAQHSSCQGTFVEIYATHNAPPSQPVTFPGTRATDVAITVTNPNGQNVTLTGSSGAGGAAFTMSTPGTYTVVGKATNTNGTGNCTDTLNVTCGVSGTGQLPTNFTFPQNVGQYAAGCSQSPCPNLTTSGSLVLLNGDAGDASCNQICAMAGGQCYPQGYQEMAAYGNCDIMSRFLAPGSQYTCQGFYGGGPLMTYYASQNRYIIYQQTDGRNSCSTSMASRLYAPCPCTR